MMEETVVNQQYEGSDTALVVSTIAVVSHSFTVFLPLCGVDSFSLSLGKIFGVLVLMHHFGVFPVVLTFLFSLPSESPFPNLI